jgi:hypothetical protein
MCAGLSPTVQALRHHAPKCTNSHLPRVLQWRRFRLLEVALLRRTLFVSSCAAARSATTGQATQLCGDAVRHNWAGGRCTTTPVTAQHREGPTVQTTHGFCAGQCLLKKPPP